MTIQEEYELSCYQPITALNEEKNVYLVKNIETNHIYIKKIINIYNKSIYQRLRNLKLKNIPEIYVCIEDHEHLIVIEEYIHGTTLEELTHAEEPFTEQDIVSIMIQLCDILRQLHECTPPIIHRDIKPSNIIISADHVIKLIDFNAAKEFETGKNEDTIFMGTRNFAAPEQYGFHQSDARTDIYAIGCTLKYLTEDLPDIHESLKNIIEKCMQMDPRNRYQNVMDLKSALTYASGSFPHTSEYKSSYRKYFPVGFRTGNPLKMIAALFYYIIIFWLSFSLTVTNSATGQPYTEFDLLRCKLGTLIIGLAYPFFLGNYLNIQYRIMRTYHSKIKHWTICICILFLFSFFIIILSTI